MMRNDIDDIDRASGTPPARLLLSGQAADFFEGDSP